MALTGTTQTAWCMCAHSWDPVSQRIRESLTGLEESQEKFWLWWDQPALPVLLGTVTCMWNGVWVGEPRAGWGVAARE